jgi:ATP-dependent Zn protease
VAGEAGVPFFSISRIRSSWNCLLGFGSSQIRDLFDQAKKQAPCIIFVDELDAIRSVPGLLFASTAGTTNRSKPLTNY